MLTLGMMFRFSGILCLLLVSCTVAERGEDSTFAELAEVSAHVHQRARMTMETESEARTYERFASAFSEMLATKESTCPYGTSEDSKKGGTTSYTCNWKSSGTGNTCPQLQQQRLKASRKFIASNYDKIASAASTFPLVPLFDKTEKIRGDETYEALVKYHIDGLMNPDVIELEDKLSLKKKAAALGVTATDLYYGVHKSKWNATEFKNILIGFCETKKDEFMIKATHLAWSEGMKIVRGWLKVCEGKDKDATMQTLADYVVTNILDKRPHATDAHLEELEAGVSVEELFRTGGNSMIPLEAKVEVIWGKVYLVWLVGDTRLGCTSQSGAWHIYGDKTGWDLKGIRSLAGGNDPESDMVINRAWDRLVETAERFARGVGADFMRVDLFLGLPENPDGEIVIKLNECESVSGHPYFWEREGMGSVWRDGYVLSDRMSMSKEKWTQSVDYIQGLRDEQNLDEH